MKNDTEMGIEALRTLLRDDFLKSSANAMSYEELVPILEDLASRKENMKAETEKAWENFVQYYCSGSVEKFTNLRYNEKNTRHL